MSPNRGRPSEGIVQRVKNNLCNKINLEITQEMVTFKAKAETRFYVKNNGCSPDATFYQIAFLRCFLQM